MQQQSTKCQCGQKTGAFCTSCSKIRMGVMLKNGFKNKGIRITFYSFLNDNNKTDEQIFEIMRRRIISKPEYTNAVNKYIFFTLAF